MEKFEGAFHNARSFSAKALRWLDFAIHVELRFRRVFGGKVAPARGEELRMINVSRMLIRST